MPTRDGKSKHESVIRVALRKRYLRHHHGRGDIFVVDELGLAHARSRIDLVIFNGHLHGYEIKSENDTLDRLPRQLNDYCSALQKLTLVVATRHLDTASAMIPDWCGLVEVLKGPRGGITLAPRRRARVNPKLDPFMLAHLLWRPEAQELLLKRGASSSKVNVPRKELYRTLANEMPIRELAPAIKAAMASRKTWRDHPRQW